MGYCGGGSGGNKSIISFFCLPVCTFWVLWLKNCGFKVKSVKSLNAFNENNLISFNCSTT